MNKAQILRTHSRTSRNWFKYYPGPFLFSKTFQALKLKKNQKAF